MATTFTINKQMVSPGRDQSLVLTFTSDNSELDIDKSSAVALVVKAELTGDVGHPNPRITINELHVGNLWNRWELRMDVWNNDTWSWNKIRLRTNVGEHASTNCFYLGKLDPQGLPLQPAPPECSLAG